MAEAIGEGRRHILDLLRGGDVETGESLLAAMEDMYGVLVTMDYPDAITMNLRRSTDVARSLIEKTRGDLSIAFVQRDLHDALDGTPSGSATPRSSGRVGAPLLPLTCSWGCSSAR